MKNQLVQLMKYNLGADRQVSRLLAELSETERALDRKAYYKSLQGLFAHITGGALFFQKLVKASFPEAGGLNHRYMDYKMESGDKAPGFSELQAALEVLDRAIVEMVESLKDEDLDRVISINFSKGRLDYPLGVFIMQYANHGTHHRGQISQILDEMGIANDFSAIAPQYE